MARTTLLLPAGEHFRGQRLGAVAAKLLGRADRMATGEPGRRAQLRRHFQLIPDHWPVAALTRQADARDAAGHGWLRADPAHVRPDMVGVRLLACGDTLQLTAADSAALLPALRPLFGDAGFPIDAPVPGRWYLRLPAEVKLPVFTEPGEALGTDLFEHLPEGDAGRHWRALANEAQVLLHNHPWNARRSAQGLPPVNALWFWGGGCLPDAVRSRHAIACSDEEQGRALAIAAGIAAALPAQYAAGEGDALYDLCAVRELAAFEHDWLLPACEALRLGNLSELVLDFDDGHGLRLARSQRWRVWRRPQARLGA